MRAKEKGNYGGGGGRKAVFDFKTQMLDGGEVSAFFFIWGDEALS